MTDKHRPSARYLLAALAAAALLAATSCELLLDVLVISGGGGGLVDPDPVYDIVPVLFTRTSADSASQIQKIDFPSSSTTLTLTGLDVQNVLLVKTNVAGAIASANNTGSVVTSSFSVPFVDARTIHPPILKSTISDFMTDSKTGRNISGVYGDLIRYDYAPAQEIYTDIPGDTASRSIDTMQTSSLTVANVPSRTFTLVGTDSREFWVSNEDQTSWWKITAVLRGIGDHCYIWVPDTNFGESSISTDNIVSLARVDELKAKFDLIYPLATDVLGYEYGGTGSGGVDNDLKISILIYDVENDYSSTQNGGVLGYFWSKDYYTAATQIHSNEAEMFYLDSHFTDAYPDYIYSTLIHEFQHMINFNKKNVENSIESVPTWFNEMLSLVAEDMIGSHPSLEISSYALPYNSRLSFFTGYYDYAGITEWLSGDDVLASYANVYAFGAYLARNYGGAHLINAIESNTNADITSISQALNDVYPVTFEDTVTGFYDVFRRYAEALIYSKSNTPPEINSFNRSVSTTYSSNTYTFPAFNIWNETNYFAGKYGVPDGYKGLLVWDIASTADMPPYSISLLSSPDWQNISGSLSITFNKPSDPDVELYLMIR